MSKNRQFGFGLALAWLAFLVSFHTPIRQRKSPGVSLFFLILWDACELKLAITAGVAVAITQFGLHQKAIRSLQNETETLRTTNQRLQENQTDRAISPAILAELEQLRAKVKELPGLRGELVALRGENEELKSTRGITSAEGETELDEATKNDPQARMQLADELIREGRFEKALEHLIWCYDEGVKASPSFVGVRSSFLLSRFAKLGTSYPPAREALIDRRDDAENRLKAGSNDQKLARDVTRLNSSLGEDSRTVELFDQIPAGDPRRGMMVGVAFAELLNAKRYDEIFAAVTPEALFEKRLQNTLMIQSRMPDNKRLQSTVLNGLILEGAMAVETLAGAEQPQRAIALIDQILEQDSSRETIEDLMRHVTRAKSSEVLQYLEGK